MSHRNFFIFCMILFPTISDAMNKQSLVTELCIVNQQSDQPFLSYDRYQVCLQDCSKGCCLDLSERQDLYNYARLIDMASRCGASLSIYEYSEPNKSNKLNHSFRKINLKPASLINNYPDEKFFFFSVSKKNSQIKANFVTNIITRIITDNQSNKFLVFDSSYGIFKPEINYQFRDVSDLENNICILDTDLSDEENNEDLPKNKNSVGGRFSQIYDNAISVVRSVANINLNH